MTQPLIELKNARFELGQRIVLDQVNVQVRPGQWLSILGPNGCGKSTLLKGLMGILPLSRGHRECHVQHFGYVAQKFSFSSHVPLTVREFLSLKLPPHLQSSFAEHQKKIVAELALDDLIDRSVHQLSGGQQQKVLLAFCLWDSPRVIMLDEYLEGIDLEAEQHILNYVRKLHASGDFSFVEVSHDISSVSRTADRVILMKQGIVAYDGSPRDRGFHACLHDIYGHSHLGPHGHG